LEWIKHAYVIPGTAVLGGCEGSAVEYPAVGPAILVSWIHTWDCETKQDLANSFEHYD
jgi:hypothetical protein